MKLKILIIMCALTLIGCDGLKRIMEGAEGHPPAPAGYENPHVVEGVTVLDRQIIEGIPINGRTVRAEVKPPGADDFRALNQYEFHLYPDGPSPALGFGGEVIILCNGHLLITGNPCAPTGTQYKIISEVTS